MVPISVPVVPALVPVVTRLISVVMPLMRFVPLMIEPMHISSTLMTATETASIASQVSARSRMISAKAMRVRHAHAAPEGMGAAMVKSAPMGAAPLKSMAVARRGRSAERNGYGADDRNKRYSPHAHTSAF